MSQVIIYLEDNNIPAVCIPTPECLQIHSIIEIAIKDVPEGKPFKIVNSSELPTEPQEVWLVEESDLIDGIGGSSNEFN
jgi:hypothetical protein